MLFFIRDINGSLIGLKDNNNTYYYLKNLQEDIIGIRDINNNIIANYKYDSFGNHIAITDGNGNAITDNTHIANINPFRYRSYYFDIETNLYYLNSRYYNSLWGRFLNADGGFDSSDLLGFNLYVYCCNNPISFIDQSGNLKIPSWLKKAVAVVATIVVAAVVAVAVVAAAPVIATAVAVTAASLGATAAVISVAATAAKVTTIAVAAAVAVNGGNRANEIVTGTNVIKDNIMQGNETAYAAFETATLIASTGIIAMGQIYSLPQPSPTSNKDVGRTGMPHSNATMNKGYYNQTRFFDYKGNASLDIDYTNHPNSLIYHSNPHFHIWDNGARSLTPWNLK